MEFLKFPFFSFLFFFLLLKMVVLLWWRPRKIESHFSKQGIRGPPYRFFIGNVKELAGMMKTASSQPMPFSHNILPRVLPFFHHWRKIYGCTFLVWFGPNYRLAVSDPDIVREIFTSKAEFYEKNEAHPLIKQLEGDGLLRLKGEKWAHHRKLISPAFHMESLKLSMPVIAKSVLEMADKWSEMADSGEVEIDVSQWFQTLTEDVVTRTAFGSSYEDGKAIFKLQALQMEIVSEALKKVHIPGHRFLPTRTNWKSRKLDREIKKSLSELIDRRRKGWSSDDKGSKDLLGLMIQACSSSSSVSSTITVNDIVEECKSFFFASKHTTSNLLTWTVILMAMHPRWQDLARDEVVTVCGSRDMPSKVNIIKLKMLNMILNESLRLYPPIVATIRRAKIDTELGGYKIPSGTEILIPIIAIHHDRSIWGNDANEFNPGRFSKGVAHAVKHPVGFFPFGLGVRKCIGQNLAVLQAKLALAMILQRFSFRLAPSYQHAPTVDMILFPQYGAPIIFRELPDHQVVSRDQGS